MFRRFFLVLMLLSSTVQAADFNFIRVNVKYYLATKGTDGSLVTKLVSVAFFDVDGVPVVPDPPGPGPGPGPTIPDGWNGLTKSMYNFIVAKVPKASRDKAGPIGDNYEAVSAKLAAGGYANIDEANAELKEKNAATTGLTRETWVPIIQEYGRLMQKLFADGKLNGLPDYADANRAVADAFHLAASAN